ncbi:MAG: hypothetical protein M0R46_11235 [Candidatus Muirbacterium halophilum]|nr:hypothetical protein [Candidatus Muirbacterium halophilum]MCK9476486.1 hypothetical protein [Candidatus Muirbacterium halophilum]
MIKEVIRLDDCKDGSIKFKVVFDFDISKQFVMSFPDNHKKTIREDFEKPYFKIDYPGFYALKGSLNSSSAKLWINKGSYTDWEKYFRKIMESV